MPHILCNGIICKKGQMTQHVCIFNQLETLQLKHAHTLTDTHTHTHKEEEEEKKQQKNRGTSKKDFFDGLNTVILNKKSYCCIQLDKYHVTENKTIYLLMCVCVCVCVCV